MSVMRPLSADGDNGVSVFAPRHVVVAQPGSCCVPVSTPVTRRLARRAAS